MKILFSMIYAPEKGGSGAPIYTRHLLDGFARRGIPTGIVFSAPTDYRSPDDAPYRSVPVRFEHPPIFDSQPKTPASVPFRDLSARDAELYTRRMEDALRQAIAREGYDLIHVQHGMYIGYAASRIRRELGIPYVVTLHVMELNFLGEFPDPIQAKVAMTEADAIIALTEAQKQRLLDEYRRDRIVELDGARWGRTRTESEALHDRETGGKDLDPARILVRPLGIDLDHYSILDSPRYPADLLSLGIQDDQQVVLFAGRLLRMKGIQHLLEAESIYNRHGDVHTIVLGGGELEEQVALESSRRAQVHYLGFCEQELMPLYHNFAAEHRGVFSVPSSSEGLSLSYLEAMASGLPVVASCQRDMGELDFMQEPGAAFSPFGDVGALGRAIRRKLDHRPLSRQELRDRVRDYSQERMFRDALGVYQECRSKDPAAQGMPTVWADD